MNEELRKPFRINAPALKAAQKCQASKDVRYYLNGVCIKTDGTVNGTNGHILFSTKCNEVDIEKDLIICFESAIPQAANNADLNFISDKRGYADFTKHGQASVIKSIFFEIIDGVFPDIDGILKKRNDTPNAVANIGINSGYLSLCQKVFNNSVVEVKIISDTDPMFFTCPRPNPKFDVDNASVLVVMPARL